MKHLAIVMLLLPASSARADWIPQTLLYTFEDGTYSYPDDTQNGITAHFHDHANGAGYFNVFIGDFPAPMSGKVLGSPLPLAHWEPTTLDIDFDRSVYGISLNFYVEVGMPHDLTMDIYLQGMVVGQVISDTGTLYWPGRFDSVTFGTHDVNAPFFAVDNIYVNFNQPAVPEPLALTMFAVGLAGIAGLRFWRQS